MAREANLAKYGDGLREGVAAFVNALERFEALVRADEREEANRRANASWTLMCEKMVAAEREKVLKEIADAKSNETNI
jgi:hypothetical protein